MEEKWTEALAGKVSVNWHKDTTERLEKADADLDRRVTKLEDRSDVR
jgi:hypothetical protein